MGRMLSSGFKQKFVYKPYTSRPLQFVATANGAGTSPSFVANQTTHAQFMWAICFNGFFWDIVSYQSTVTGAPSITPLVGYIKSTLSPLEQMAYVQPGGNAVLGVVNVVGPPQQITSGVNGLVMEYSNYQYHWCSSMAVEYVPAHAYGGPANVASNGALAKTDLYWSTNPFCLTGV